jgi:hypothetical protein
LKHTFVKRKQFQHFEHLKERVDGKSVVLQVDFSENFSFREQNEIQAAHWSNAQCTLFTAFAWLGRNETQSYVLVSDNLDHGKVSVYTYLNDILKDMKLKNPDIDEVHIFSDGAASQFKQRFLFSNLVLFQKNGLKVTWNFFATSHGKGVVDGIGGCVKGSVWRRILCGIASVRNGREFSHLASQLNQKICIKYIALEEFYQHERMLQEWWTDVQSIPNTQQIHFVKPLSDSTILVGELSSGHFTEFTLKKSSTPVQVASFYMLI